MLWKKWLLVCENETSYTMYSDDMQKVSDVCTLYVCVCTVSPDAIHEHVKTKIEGTKRMHYTAPEYAGEDRDN